MPFLTRSLCLVVVLIGALPALAQQATVPHESSIQVNVFAAPGSATDLSPSDLQLLDNKQPRPITSLRRAGTAADPVHVIVVLDAVNIPYIRTAYERSEIEKYFRSNGGKLANPTTFAVLSDRSNEVQQGFSTDGNALSAALDKYPIGLREIRRDQGFWGAEERTQVSLKGLSELTTYAASIPGEKLMLWVSPGWPLLSGARIDLSNQQHQEIFRSVVDYARRLRLAKVTLFNINPIGPEEDLLRANYYEDFLKGISRAQDTDIADLSLQVLSVQTGGRTITGNSDVSGNLQRCVAEAGSLYELTFTPAPAEHADEFHSLQVNSTKTGITARTRTGYYAQP